MSINSKNKPVESGMCILQKDTRISFEIQTLLPVKFVVAISSFFQVLNQNGTDTKDISHGIFIMNIFCCWKEFLQIFKYISLISTLKKQRNSSKVNNEKVCSTLRICPLFRVIHNKTIIWKYYKPYLLNLNSLLYGNRMNGYYPHLCCCYLCFVALSSLYLQ